METNTTLLHKLKREVIPGINLFELVLFSISSTLGIILFALTLTIWSDGDNGNTATNIISLIDIPVGVIAATFLAKRSKLAPLLLSIDALLYGGANFISGQFALGTVNFIITPLLYMYAFIWIWPKQKNEDTNEVKTRKFNLTTGLLISGLIIFVAVMFGVTMSLLGDHSNKDELPNWVFWFSTWFDSFAAALMLAAVIASMFRFRESWYFYFVSNILKIILFTTLVIYGDLGSIELLLLAVTYFINALFGMLIWKESEVVVLKSSDDSNATSLKV